MTGTPPQFSLGKSFPAFAPIGPAVVSVDSLADPSTTWRCGATSRASGCRTAGPTNLIFSIPTLVAYLSSICTLEPGDLIFTGTPDGVGMARGRFLAEGDVIVSGAEGIGELRNTCVAGPGTAAAMSLHRLLGFDAAVPDPGALSAFYAELGLSGDAAVRVHRHRRRGVGDPLRRPLPPARLGVGRVPGRVRPGGHRRAAGGRGGRRRRIADGVLAVVDPATRVRFEVRVAGAAPAQQAPPTLVVPNAPGAVVRPDRRAPTVLEGPRPPRRLGHLVIGTPGPGRHACPSSPTGSASR